MSLDLLSAPPPITRTGAPAHAQIQRWLAEAISRAEVEPGERLPSERELASALGVSRMTLRQALAALEERGLIVRSRGGSGGSFVARRVFEMDLTQLVGLKEQVRRGNQRAGAKLVSADTVIGDRPVLAALRLPEQSLVHRIVRVRLADDLPVSLEESYLPAQLFPELLGGDLGGSMYELLASFSYPPTSATETISPGVVRTREAELLGVPRRTAVLRAERLVLAARGLPVDFAYDVFHPDRVRLSVRTSLADTAALVTRSGLGDEEQAASS